MTCFVGARSRVAGVTRVLMAVAVVGLVCARDVAAAHANATPYAMKPAGFDPDEALALSQAAIGRRLTDHEFVDAAGGHRTLAEYRGKPLLVSLIYTSCHHICPTTTRHLDAVVRSARNVLGEDSFSVVTIGFDTAHDTPAAMREFARQQKVSGGRWDFLAGNAEVVAAIAAELGFRFAPVGGAFEHLLQTSLIDGDGVIRRHVYGLDYDAPALVEPLKRLVFGEDIEDSFFDRMANRFRIFCTVYDPASDSYRFDYSIVVGIAVAAVIGACCLFLLAREWRTSLRARSRQV